MQFQISLSAKAQKQLNDLEKQEKDKVIKQLVFLTSNPFLGKKLKGEFEGYYSVRAWPYRIVYKIQKQELIVWIIRIEHRQGVYK